MRLNPELRGWYDFRTQKWIDAVEFPNITMQQAQSLLTL